MDTQRWRRGRSQPLGLCAMIHQKPCHTTPPDWAHTCWQANLGTLGLWGLHSSVALRKGPTRRKASPTGRDPLWPCRTHGRLGCRFPGCGMPSLNLGYQLPHCRLRTNTWGASALKHTAKHVRRFLGRLHLRCRRHFDWQPTGSGEDAPPGRKRCAQR